MIKNILLTFSVILITSGCYHKTDLDDIKLVVFISVDQMSVNLLEQYEPLYTGGFRWMMNHGYHFTNAHHEHGYTTTGPGHFVLGSGQYPGPNGILGNYWYDRELKKVISCVEDTVSTVVGESGPARSYRHIQTTALGDWVKNMYPTSKIFSVAGKDRSAVMMGGKHPDLALYYNWRGAFVTSSYYADTLPNWATQFNENLNVAAYRDSIWKRSLPIDVYDRYAHQDFFEGESDRYHSEPYSPTFPIGFDENLSDDDILDDFFGFPWMEKATVDLANVIIHAENLGRDNTPDILFVGFSATDALIHYYGPNSHEGMDTMLKNDRYLGSLISTVDEEIGLENVLFILTGDHGGLELPEHRRQMGLPAGRISRAERKAAVNDVFSALTNEYGAPKFVVKDGDGFYYDVHQMKERGIKKSDVDNLIISRMEKIEGIAKVLKKEDILKPTSDDKILLRIKNSYHTINSPDLWILNEKYWLTKSLHGTSHGTPYDYDTHVPLYFSHVTFSPAKSDDHVATVDIAPTIAKILGVVPDRTDGKVLRLGERVKR